MKPVEISVSLPGRLPYTEVSRAAKDFLMEFDEAGH